MADAAKDPRLEALAVLMTAAEQGRTDIVKMVAEGKKVSLSAPRKGIEGMPDDGKTALHVAAERGNVDVVRALLKEGVDVGARDGAGQQPCSVASPACLQAIEMELFQRVALGDSPGVRQLLCDTGLSHSCSDGSATGDRPLHWASSFGNAEMVATLLECGADLDAPNAEGATPLHEAASKNAVGCLEALLEGGAAAGVAGHKGYSKDKTALAVAELNGHAAAAAALQAAAEAAPSTMAATTVATSAAAAAPPPAQLPARPTRKAALAPFPMLWPPPRTVRLGDGACQLPQRVRIAAPGGALASGAFWSGGAGGPSLANSASYKILRAALLRAGVASEPVSMRSGGGGGGTPPSEIVLMIKPELFPRSQGYRLVLRAEGEGEGGGGQCRVIAADGAGLFYGVLTLAQLIAHYGVRQGPALQLPAAAFEDWPDFACRAVLLECRGWAMPHRSELQRTIATLAAWKVNQVQLLVHVDDGGLADLPNFELLQLDAFCASRFVTLVPVIAPRVVVAADAPLPPPAPPVLTSSPICELLRTSTAAAVVAPCAAGASGALTTAIEEEAGTGRSVVLWAGSVSDDDEGSSGTGTSAAVAAALSVTSYAQGSISVVVDAVRGCYADGETPDRRARGTAVVRAVREQAAELGERGVAALVCGWGGCAPAWPSIAPLDLLFHAAEAALEQGACGLVVCGHRTGLDKGSQMAIDVAGPVGLASGAEAHAPLLCGAGCSWCVESTRYLLQARPEEMAAVPLEVLLEAHALGGLPAAARKGKGEPGDEDGWVQHGVARVLGWPSGGTSAADRALWRLLVRGSLDACVSFDSIKLAFSALQQQRQVLLAAKPPDCLLQPVSAADLRPGPHDRLREAALSWREALLSVDLLRLATRAAQVLLRARRKR